MPELPEVEVTRRGLAPFVVGKTIESLTVRQSRLRWPIPDHLAATLAGAQIMQLRRRGKYLLWSMGRGKIEGTLLVHLGMSGSLRVLDADVPAAVHDHVDVCLTDGHSKTLVRYRDPRRFGAWLWQNEADGDPLNSHYLLARLGPEPLDAEFAGDAGGLHLFEQSRGRRLAVKAFLMDGHTVVGVGNIYASESLFLAGIAPQTPAGALTLVDYQRLAAAVRHILAKAIEQGGSSLRDFVHLDGGEGCFQLETWVYDRRGLPCRTCKTPIEHTVIGQRSTYFCPFCQSEAR
jgi:formamidopyrimidine-DNA glycosylase